MIYMRGTRNKYEALTLIEIHARMIVVSRIRGEYLAETKTLNRGHQFYLIRRAHGKVICRDFTTGDMFFMREFDYMEALQEGRIKQFFE